MQCIDDDVVCVGETLLGGGHSDGFIVQRIQDTIGAE